MGVRIRHTINSNEEISVPLEGRNQSDWSTGLLLGRRRISVQKIVECDCEIKQRIGARRLDVPPSR